MSLNMSRGVYAKKKIIVFWSFFFFKLYKWLSLFLLQITATTNLNSLPPNDAGVEKRIERPRGTGLGILVSPLLYAKPPKRGQREGRRAWCSTYALGVFAISHMSSCMRWHAGQKHQVTISYGWFLRRKMRAMRISTLLSTNLSRRRDVAIHLPPQAPIHPSLFSLSFRVAQKTNSLHICGQGSNKEEGMGPGQLKMWYSVSLRHLTTTTASHHRRCSHCNPSPPWLDAAYLPENHHRDSHPPLKICRSSMVVARGQWHCLKR